MTRNEYIRQLVDQLSFLDEQAQSAALSFYDEMLDDLMEEGKSEAEAVAAMDPPAEIAERLRAESNHSPASAADASFERQTLTCDVSGLHTIRLEALNTPINVTPCTGSKVTLAYTSTLREHYEAVCQNGVLTLSCQARGGLSLRQIFGLYRPQPVELHLPPSACAALSLRTSNSPIDVKGEASSPFRFTSVTLNSSNGPLRLTHLHSNEGLNAQTRNGRIQAQGLESGGAMELATSNAPIQAETLAAREIRLATSNARLNAHQLTSQGALTLATSNGSIQVEQLQAAAITLRTSNGSIQGTLPGRQADWAITSRTSNASSSLPTEQPGEKPLSVRTSNGAIRLGFEA